MPRPWIVSWPGSAVSLVERAGWYSAELSFDPRQPPMWLKNGIDSVIRNAADCEIVDMS